MITAPVKWTRPCPIFLSQQIRRIILSLYYCNPRSEQGIQSHTNHRIVTPLSQIKIENKNNEQTPKPCRSRRQCGAKVLFAHG